MLSISPAPPNDVFLNEEDEGFGSSHLRVNFPIGRTMEFTLPTKNYEQITLDFLTRRSGSGAGQQTLSYTTDGETWNEHQTYTVDAANPQLRNFDFSDIPEISDNRHFAIRITFGQGAGGEVGNNRFDDISLRGVLVPDPNFPPEIISSPSATLALRAGGDGTLFDLSDMFSDPENDPLAFSVHSENNHIVQADLEDGVLLLSGLLPGESRITIQAEDDQDNVPATVSFVVLVHPATHDLSAGDFSFTSWNSASPALTFPAHMLFVQSEQNDPDLSAPLHRAYHIPAEDAATEEDEEHPYAAESRTRINGLGEDGISFVNTGRGRDLGAALLALDTRGLEHAEISFTAGTRNPGMRIQALRLQYRIGHEGPFHDFPESVEYVRSPEAGDFMDFGPLALPPDALDQEYVQLSWRYHHLEGSSGQRAEIRLDDIIVTGETPAVEPTGYAAWLAGQFPDPDDLANPDISGPNADPLCIGVPNLLRYALDIETTEDLPVRLPRLALQPPSGIPLFRFAFDPSKDDLIWLVEASGDLTDWEHILFHSQNDPSPAPDENGWIEIPDPEAGDRRFYRLNVLLEGN